MIFDVFLCSKGKGIKNTVLDKLDTGFRNFFGTFREYQEKYFTHFKRWRNEIDKKLLKISINTGKQEDAELLKNFLKIYYEIFVKFIIQGYFGVIKKFDIVYKSDVDDIKIETAGEITLVSIPEKYKNSFDMFIKELTPLHEISKLDEKNQRQYIEAQYRRIQKLQLEFGDNFINELVGSTIQNIYDPFKFYHNLGFNYVSIHLIREQNYITIGLSPYLIPQKTSEFSFSEELYVPLNKLFFGGTPSDVDTQKKLIDEIAFYLVKNYYKFDDPKLTDSLKAALGVYFFKMSDWYLYHKNKLYKFFVNTLNTLGHLAVFLRYTIGVIPGVLLGGTQVMMFKIYERVFREGKNINFNKALKNLRELGFTKDKYEIASILDPDMVLRGDMGKIMSKIYGIATGIIPASDGLKKRVRDALNHAHLGLHNLIEHAFLEKFYLTNVLEVLERVYLIPPKIIEEGRLQVGEDGILYIVKENGLKEELRHPISKREININDVRTAAEKVTESLRGISISGIDTQFLGNKSLLMHRLFNWMGAWGLYVTKAFPKAFIEYQLAVGKLRDYQCFLDEIIKKGSKIGRSATEALKIELESVIEQMEANRTIIKAFMGYIINAAFLYTQIQKFQNEDEQEQFKDTMKFLLPWLQAIESSGIFRMALKTLDAAGEMFTDPIQTATAIESVFKEFLRQTKAFNYIIHEAVKGITGQKPVDQALKDILEQIFNPMGALRYMAGLQGNEYYGRDMPKLEKGVWDYIRTYLFFELSRGVDLQQKIKQINNGMLLENEGLLTYLGVLSKKYLPIISALITMPEEAKAVQGLKDLYKLIDNDKTLKAFIEEGKLPDGLDLEDEQLRIYGKFFDTTIGKHMPVGRKYKKDFFERILNKVEKPTFAYNLLIKNLKDFIETENPESLVKLLEIYENINQNIDDDKKANQLREFLSVIAYAESVQPGSSIVLTSWLWNTLKKNYKDEIETADGELKFYKKFLPVFSEMLSVFLSPSGKVSFINYEDFLKIGGKYIELKYPEFNEKIREEIKKGKESPIFRHIAVELLANYAKRYGDFFMADINTLPGKIWTFATNGEKIPADVRAKYVNYLLDKINEIPGNFITGLNLKAGLLLENWDILEKIGDLEPNLKENLIRHIYAVNKEIGDVIHEYAIFQLDNDEVLEKAGKKRLRIPRLKGTAIRVSLPKLKEYNTRFNKLIKDIYPEVQRSNFYKQRFIPKVPKLDLEERKQAQNKGKPYEWYSKALSDNIFENVKGIKFGEFKYKIGSKFVKFDPTKLLSIIQKGRG